MIDKEVYNVMFQDFVRTKLSCFYHNIGPFYSARNKDGSPDSLTYFRAHFDRFWPMIEMCLRNNVDSRKMNRIGELGSFYPYVSYFFKLENPKLKIDLYDIIIREHCEPGTEPYDVDNVRLIDFNLCSDDFGDAKYDLLFLSEVMEHLPSNLFDIERKVIEIMKDGGYLLVTYPLHGKNAKDYGINLGQYDCSKLQEGHIREFTDDTTSLFFTSLEKVDSLVGKFKAYGKIKLILYRR
jgi:hypothetical protein